MSECKHARCEFGCLPLLVLSVAFVMSAVTMLYVSPGSLEGPPLRARVETLESRPETWPAAVNDQRVAIRALEAEVRALRAAVEATK